MFVFASNALATPSIIKPTGIMLGGESITVVGSGFGTKFPVAPILWETFDNGVNGVNLSTNPNWISYSGTGATYSATKAYGGNGLAAHNQIVYPDAEMVGFRTNAFVFPATDELYYSFMSSYSGTGAGGDIYKNGRINTGTSGSALYSGDGMIAISDNYLFYRPDSTSVYPAGRGFTFDLANSNWQRHQMYGKLSTPAGAANGEIWVQIATENKSYPNIVTRAAGYSFKYRSIILGLMMANIEAGDSHHMYVDDVYVDNTQARIEFCDAPAWANRTACDPQIPAAWSDSSITATVNQGAFTIGDTVYIYVVDASGNVNSNGVPILIGGTYGSNSVEPPVIIDPPGTIDPPSTIDPSSTIEPPKNLRLITTLN